MKKIGFLLSLLALAGPASADPFTDFKTRVREELIKPFALDLGGLLGGASFSDGRSLGFPGGSLRFVGVVQSNPDKNNLVLRDAGVKAFGFPMVEAAVGLPYKFDVVVHGMEANRVTVIGGGLRYCLYRSGLVDKFIPNIGVGAYGDKVNHSFFKAEHFAFNAVASWTLPLVHPFVGAGADLTRVKIGSAANAALTAAQNAALDGLSATAAGSRFVGGVDVTPFPFARIHAAFTLLHGVTGGSFGAGIQF